MSFCGGQVTGVNAEKKLVKLADGKEVKYDKLLIATGAM